MPRLLSLVLIFAVSTMCLPSDWTVAQESKQKCKECPVAQTAKTNQFEFNLPGFDFPMGVHIAVEHNDTPGDHAKVEGSIEIECECLNSSGIPFLSSMQGKLFKNVGLPSHPPCCAVAKTDSCDGKCCAIDSDECSGSCEACGQESTCEECDGCPSAKTGFLVKGPDRVFTTGIATSSNSCPACKQTDDCQECEGCPAACLANKIQTKVPQDVQLVSYLKAASQTDNSRSEFNEEVLQLRLENERLKMEVEAAEQRLEMMEEMMEMREENAILRTQLEFLKAHRGHSATPAHAPHHAK